MRILMVTTRMPKPGRPSTMAPLARQIDSLRALGIDINVLEMRGFPVLKYLQTLPSFLRMVPAADLIHAHFGYCGWLARCQLNKPVIVSFMGSDLLGEANKNGSAKLHSRLFVQVNRLLARNVDSVIVKSAELARVVAPVPAHIIPNGVDMDLFHPIDMADARTKLGLRRDKRYVLFPGNPANPRKGFALAKDTVQSASIILNEDLELLPLSGVVPSQVPLYMNACNAMLMTSLWEGSPNVVKEAMACNRPVVSVPVGDVPELLSGVSGCTVGPRSPDLLAQLLVKTLETRPLSDGRDALVRKGLDLGSVAERIADIYEDVLDRNPEKVRTAA